MNERQFKGIWIPAEIWLDRRLQWNEKILLLEVDSFTGEGQECYFSNEYLAEILNVSDRQIRNYIAHLVELGYLAQPRYDGRNRYLESRLGHFQAEWKSISGKGGNKFPGRAEINFHHNKQVLINTDNNNSPFSDEKERVGARARFVPPTLDEVSDFIREKGVDVDPEAFHAFYTSNGWKVGGRAPMKDWHAAVTTWAKRNRAAKPNTPPPTPSPQRQEKEDVFVHNMRVVDRLTGSHHYEDYLRQKNGGHVDEQ
jgi:hypothetical protein